MTKSVLCQYIEIDLFGLEDWNYFCRTSQRTGTDILAGSSALYGIIDSCDSSKILKIFL